MDPSFTDKIILITGAASGIGRATSIKLSHLGATLALTDINAAGLEETLSICKPGAHITSVLDISSTAACKDFVSLTASAFNRIDHIFNCAGTNPTPLATETISDEYWEKMLDTNLKAVFAITRAAIPHLSSGCSIVNTSSTLGLHARPLFAPYVASKFGVIGFSKSLALELGPKGIRVNVVAPGYIDTPTNAGVLAGEETVRRLEGEISLGRFGRVEEVADVVVFLMGKGAGYVSGSVVEVDGGLGKGSI